jgi:hypothetical protein
MVTFSIDTPDQEVRKMVTEWVGLLAAREYQQALDMLYHDNTGTSEVERPWTPERLVKYINNYGLEEPLPPRTKEQYEKDMLERYGRLEGINEWQPDEPEISWVTPITEEIEETYERFLKVDRVSTYGLDRKYYSGMVHVDLPINGFLSDLTARFFIRKIGEKDLALELYDLHVM